MGISLYARLPLYMGPSGCVCVCVCEYVTAGKYVHYFQLNWWVQRAGKNIAKMYIYAKINNYLRAAEPHSSAIAWPQETWQVAEVKPVAESAGNRFNQATVSFNQGPKLLHLPPGLTSMFVFRNDPSALTKPVPTNWPDKCRSAERRTKNVALNSIKLTIDERPNINENSTRW